MEMENMINEFIVAMAADGKSKCTTTAYMSDLSEFSKYVKDYIQKDINGIKYSDLQQWKNHLEDQGLSAQTRARKISTVRTFFKYLSKMDYLTGKNPADGLETPKLPKKQPQVISTGQARDLLNCTIRDEFGQLTCFRDYTIIAMFIYTGIRREELTNILLSDISMENGTILIHGKGNKERTVYINSTLHPILTEYLVSYRKLFKTSEESKYLFPSRKNDKLSVNAVNNIVNKAMESAGIKKSGVSAHVLRKRFATTVFSNTQDIATTSKLLGHSSPTVTMRYVMIDEMTMRNATATAANF